MRKAVAWHAAGRVPAGARAGLPRVVFAIGPVRWGIARGDESAADPWHHAHQQGTAAGWAARMVGMPGKRGALWVRKSGTMEHWRRR